jgi:hypothetical protein
MCHGKEAFTMNKVISYLKYDIMELKVKNVFQGQRKMFGFVI